MPESFYDYVYNRETENVALFRLVFRESLDSLPLSVCSSKVIWEALKSANVNDDISTNNLKSKVFREAFGEYFKWKLNRVVADSVSHEILGR